MESILDSLNPEQREAVTLTEGPLLVIAGAGSGKTRVITHRIAHLVRELNVPPWGIFAATFTNKAAGEMRHRVGAMLPGYETARLTVATFHSICVSILRREASAAGLGPRFTIADDTDQLALIKDCLRDLDIPNSRIKPEEIRNWIAKAKLHAASAAEVRAAVCRTGAPENAAALYAPEELREALAAELIEDRMNVFSAYESRLAQSNAVDFDDLLIKVVRLFRERVDILRLYQDRWHYLLVDEYQDTNRVQCELVRLLAGERRNLCVVGDEDQSIYSWRGAEIENILNFPNEYPGTRIVRLEQNYRSRQTILHAAEAVIEHNTQRHGKKLWSERGEGEPITLIEGMSERDEAAQVVETIRRLHDQAGVPYRDIAVFYRINALSRLFEDFLRESKINYRVIGGVRFYDRMEIKDLLAYLKLIVNPVDGLSLTRIVNKPRRGIGDKTLTRLFNEASKKGVSLWQQMMSASGDEEIPKKSRAGIADLLAKIDRWRDLSQNRTPVELLDAVLRDTGYEESLGSERDLETLSRLENIGELRKAIEEYAENNPEASLDGYLDMVTLATATDDMAEDDDSVSLMTLHCAKGLEFPCVFITGLEESIFPSGRAVADGRGIEEERRLFYVGVTRAKDRLFLSRADTRSLYGRQQYNPPSLFLLEVPKGLTQSLSKAIRSLKAEAKEIRPKSTRASAPALADVQAVEEEGLFPPGSRIRHARLGEGEVLSVKGSGDQRKLAIRFDRGLEVEVLEKYGGLQSVGELPF